MSRYMTFAALTVLVGLSPSWPHTSACGEDLPLRVLYTNDFEQYVPGELVGQYGWTAGPNPGSALVVADPAKMAEVKPPASGHTYLYHDLDAIAETGAAAFRVDARHSGSSGWAYFVLGDSDLGTGDSEFSSSAAIFGFNTNRFLARLGDGQGGFGSATDVRSGVTANPNTWYTFVTTMHFTGPHSNTWDLEVFERDSGNPVWNYSGAGFTTDYTNVTDIGVFVSSAADTLYFDNLWMANVNAPDDRWPINRITHGDFDRIEVGTWPDKQVPVGGWQVSATYPETNDNQLTIAQRPGAEPGDHALRIHVTNPGAGNRPYAEQLLTTPYLKGHHKLIMEHEQVTVEGYCGADVLISDGATRNPLVTYGLRDQGGASGTYHVRIWPGTGSDNVAEWTPGKTYQFRTSVDLMENTYDLYIRSPDDARYERWTQVGKNIGLPSGADPFTQLDRVAFGQFHRPADVYIDNVVAYSSGRFPTMVHYTNNFEQYELGDLVGQHGWTEDTAQVNAEVNAEVIAEGATKLARVGGGGGSNFHLYQDLDAIAETGEVAFRVDARYTGLRSGQSGAGWGYFMLGDSDFGGPEGSAPTAAAFGFRDGRFIVRSGDGEGSWVGDPNYTPSPSNVTADPDTWYTFLATMHFTGPERNTWDLQVFERDTQELVWSESELGFRTDFTNLTRMGIFVTDNVEHLYFDNLWLANVPEPAAAAMLALGLPLLLLLRRRRARVALLALGRRSAPRRCSVLKHAPMAVVLVLASLWAGLPSAEAAPAGTLGPAGQSWLHVNPYDGIDWDQVNQYKGAFHVHIVEANHTVAEIVQLHEQYGFDIFSRTEKNSWSAPSSTEMLVVPAFESTANREHTIGLFVEPGTGYTFSAVESAGGVQWHAHPNDPGRPTYSVAEFASFLSTYDSLIGFEVISRNYHPQPGDGDAVHDHRRGEGNYVRATKIWDEILADYGMINVYGVGVTDGYNLTDNLEAEGESIYNWSWTTVLAEERTLDAVKQAMSHGQMFWVSNMGEHAPPSVTNISVDETGIHLSLDGAYEEVRWIYRNDVVHQGLSFGPGDLAEGQNYVRFEVWGNPDDYYESSIVGSQPFGMTPAATPDPAVLKTYNYDLGTPGIGNRFAGLAAAPDPAGTGAVWSEGTSASSGNPLVDSLGNPSDVIVWLEFLSAYGSGNAGYNRDPGSNDNKLQGDYFWVRQAGLDYHLGYYPVDVKGLDPDQLYDIYIYGAANYGTTVTLGEETYTMDGSVADPDAPVWVESRHYVAFRGLSGSSEYSLRLGIAEGSSRLGFSGLQVVLVPEPSSIVLLLFAVISVLSGRGRRGGQGTSLP